MASILPQSRVSFRCSTRVGSSLNHKHQTRPEKTCQGQTLKLITNIRNCWHVCHVLSRLSRLSRFVTFVTFFTVVMFCHVCHVLSRFVMFVTASHFQLSSNIYWAGANHRWNSTQKVSCHPCPQMLDEGAIGWQCNTHQLTILQY